MAYQSIFERMNRKQKREFEKLPVEEKEKIFQTEISKAITESVERSAARSVYIGYLEAHKMLAEEFVIPASRDDLSDEDFTKIVKSLFGRIMENYKVEIKDSEESNKNEGEKE